MGRMKDWMMDMEDNIVSAIESGAKSTDDVVAFARISSGPRVQTKACGRESALIFSCDLLFWYSY